MTRAAVVCGVPGCPRPATRDGRCDEHRPKRGRPWRRLRLAVLQRDGYRCVVCGALTREVHHVRPMILGGVELPPLAEVEARCRRHNPRGPTQG